MITQDQVLNCNDEQQLTDWCAEYCMGWYKSDEPLEEYVFGNYESYFWWREAAAKRLQLRLHEWQPLANTEKGKAQCFDLMVKYRIWIKEEPDYPDNTIWIASAKYPYETTDVEELKLQTAIVKAALRVEIAKRGWA